ncbi:MAG: sulfatase-like hydrolase/transferase [Candidatus Lokiarchaeota archaeon]|nr:sulfatase-like hydrolase/transferase [Candidatus Lokiarchaeota archaeon]MBD3338712.1 sulfatase-like hydrolase/transferase [Candidatus Lokiarchaeota archaeon]
MKKRPNIVFLLNDHQAFYAHGEPFGGPKIQKPHFEKLAKDGVEFSRAYTCCPLCAPARRSMLTGVFPHTHGELSNISFNPFRLETYLDKLAEAGYENYYYGKWHAGPGTAHDHHCEGFSYPDYNNPYTKPEYEEYIKEKNLSTFKVKLQRNFMDPNTKHGKKLQSIMESGGYHSLTRDACNENSVGVMVSPKESHEAFFLTHLACEKLSDIAKKENQNPFHLRVDFWGPHQPYFAPQEYIDLYPPEDIPEHPSFRDNLENKPKLYKSERNYPLNKYGNLVYPNPLPWSEWQKVLAVNYAQQTLIDEAGGIILDTLEKLGLGDNTIVMWVADHGDALGCHGGHFDKDAYMPEEMIRIPMALKFPGKLPSSCKVNKLVSNLDIPLTFLDAAGCSFSHSIHGRSLLPIFCDENIEWRKDLMCETNGHFSVHIGRALITDRFKYIFNDRDLDELYDLKVDPYEMNNLIKNEEYSEIIKDMKLRLRKWREKTNDKITRKEIRKDRMRFAQENLDKATLLDL